MENNKPNKAVQNGEELNTEDLQSAELSDEELDGVNGGGAFLNAAVAGIMVMSAAAPTVAAAAEQPALVEEYSPEESDAESILDTVTVEIDKMPAQSDYASGLKAEGSAADRICVSSKGVLKGNASIVYPFKKYNYLVRIDGVDVGGFNEVSAPDLSTDSEVYQEEESYKQPGSSRYGNLILKNGGSSSTFFYDWMREVEGGTVNRRNITIVLVDDTMFEVASLLIKDAYPISYNGIDSNATSSEMTIDTIVLAHDGITMTK